MGSSIHYVRILSQGTPASPSSMKHVIVRVHFEEGSLTRCSSSVVQALGGNISICSYVCSQRYCLKWVLTCLQKALNSSISPSHTHPLSGPTLNWWTSLGVPRSGEEDPLFFGVQEAMLIFCDGLYSLMLCKVDLLLLSSRRVLVRPLLPCRILLLSRYCLSRYVTFFTKHATFLAKYMALLMKCVTQLISLL